LDTWLHHERLVLPTCNASVTTN